MMNVRRKYGLLILMVGFVITLKAQKTINFTTKDFQVSLNEKGFITHFIDRKTNTEYLPHGQKTALMSLLKGETYLQPTSMDGSVKKNEIRLKYNNGSVATISVRSKGAYLRLELRSLTPRNGVSAIVWGPYATTINETIGETIGVVRNDTFAIGAQGLNIKTVEGLPFGDKAGGYFIDPLPGQTVPDSIKPMIGKRIEVNVNQTGDMPDYVRLYRGTAAVKKEFGSELRLFSRDYRKPRVIPVWEGPASHKQYVEPIDVDFTGSAIALFGCPATKTLDVIEKIELGEGLPHPEIDGVWVKRSRVPGQAYLLNEGDPLVSIKYAKEAGFKLIHLGDFFESWGHFGLKTKRFPGGAADIKRATALAGDEGIKLGVHTLTMFTSTDDPYVTPVPSDSLAKAGSTVLSRKTGIADKELFIEDPAYFHYLGSTHTVKVGKELINYRGVSKQKPWRLLGCQRGAFGTKVTEHPEGVPVDKLINNVYNGFYPDIHLQQQYARRLAQVCNETGVGLMDFDGYPHGASSPTGHDLYAAGLFIDTWYKNLDHYVMNCGAGTFQYFWHIYSFMNWGEPWYNNLRESQVNYRIENQRYFKRNLMPGMLGWFSLAPTYRPEEVEWIQARSAGFDAGYLLRIDKTIENNGFRDELFRSIKLWQKARNAHAFSSDQQKKLQDPKNEFHLEEKAPGKWLLYPVKLSGGFEHKFRQAQTGEPVISHFKVVNPYRSQPLRFYINAVSVENDNEATTSRIVLKINGYQMLELDTEMKAGERLYCDGTKIYLCDHTWKKIKEIPVSSIPSVEPGDNDVQIEAGFSTESAPKLSVEFKFVGDPEEVEQH